MGGNKKAISIGHRSIVLGQLLVYKHGGNIVIGNDCFIGEDARIWSANNITIGNNVLISHGVNIHDNDSHSMSAIRRHRQIVEMFSVGHPKILEDVPSKSITIQDDAWIGFNTTILKGVCIGQGAVVGANSVVTKNVGPYSIVAGNPARIIGVSKK